MSGLQGPWELLAIIDSAVTGQEVNHNPSLAKQANSTLYVDSQGYAHLLVSSGEDLPNFNTWRVRQVRMKVASEAFAYDSFRNVPPNRDSGDPLAGTQTEIAGRTWSTSGTFALVGDALVPGEVADHLIGNLPLGSTTPLNISAEIDIHGNGWVGIGFTSNDTGMFGGGQVWALLNSTPGNVEVWANGIASNLANVAIPNRDPAGFDELRLFYDPVENVVSVVVNGESVVSGFDLDSLPFTPNIAFATVHFFMTDPAATRVDFLSINDTVIFRDDFESANTSHWSETG